MDLDANTVTVEDIVFNLQGDTRFEDRSAANQFIFSREELNDGDSVEVRGYSDGTEFFATRIERIDPPGFSGLQGFVTNPSAFDFQVFGITVAPTTANFFDATGAAITETDFFAGLAAGDLVRATGSINGAGLLQATDVSLVTPDL